MKEITFVTGNQKKAEQLEQHLGFDLQHASLDLPEIQSLDLQEVVTEKATRAYKEFGGTVLVEDVSLTFAGMGNLPGPLIRWFLESIGNEGLIRLVNGSESRQATARCMFCLFDGTSYKYFEGNTDGVISEFVHGTNGFGWDSIFIPEGYGKTWAAMDEATQAETSMRKKALVQLAEYLQRLNT